MSKGKTIPANNFDVAMKQIKFDVDINSEISESESKMYHVAIVTRVLIQSEERYETHVNVAKYHPEVFHAFKKDGFTRAGIKNMYIIHDPSKVVEVVEEKLTSKGVIALIEKAETVEEVEELLIDETRSTVKKAGQKRIDELNS